MRVYPEGGSQDFETVILRTIPDELSFEHVDFKQLLLKHLAPGLGCIIAFIMFFSPMKAVQQVRRQKHLGDLNPLPLIAIIANCLVWLVYGSITRDPYVIMANEPGLLLGVYMTFTAYGYADSKARDLMLRVALLFAAAISATSISICFFLDRQADRVQAAGYQAVGVLLLYYAAPLSVLAEVLRARSCAQLYWPLSIMSCVNGGLWVTYGLAVHDTFIWAPNAVGATFGAIQLLLISILPNKPGVASHSPRRSVNGGMGAAGGGGAGDDEGGGAGVRSPLMGKGGGGGAAAE